MMAAFVNPVVPLVLMYAAGVAGSSTSTQSCSPCSSRAFHDRYRAGTSSPRKFRTKIFESGIPHSLAAAIEISSVFNSVKKNFAPVILTWWVSSRAV